MQEIQIDDTTLYHECRGRGPAMLFVHGLYGDARVWEEQARRFESRFTCVRYDRRGYGRSGRGTAGVSHALHADDAAALIEALGLSPCLLIGSSGGAAIGVDVARRYGCLLRVAVFSEPPLFSLDPDAGPAVMGAVQTLLERAMARGVDGPRAAVDAFCSFMCPGLWSAIDEERRDRYRANAEIGLDDLRSPSLAITPDDLATVTVPSLVIAGTTSHPALRSVAHRLAAGLPDVRFVELEECAHVTYAEQPDAFFQAVSAFAAELDHRDAVASTRREAS